MRGDGRLMAAALGALLVGLVLMIPFEGVLTRIAGVAALFAFIALGVFAIASPQWLDETDGTDSDEEEQGVDGDQRPSGRETLDESS